MIEMWDTRIHNFENPDNSFHIAKKLFMSIFEEFSGAN